jgi:hypothetical protein
VNAESRFSMACKAGIEQAGVGHAPWLFRKNRSYVEKSMLQIQRFTTTVATILVNFDSISDLCGRDLQALLPQIPSHFATAWVRAELIREYLAQDLLDLGRGCFLVRMAVLHR